jgi:hypothetical protein
MSTTSKCPISELNIALIESLEEIEGHPVEAANDRAARRIVGDTRDAQAGGRVDDDIIEAQFVHALVPHARHHRGRAVEGVGRLPAPEAFHAHGRAARSAGVSLSGSGMRRCACRKPSAPRLPAASRILSANTGAYSTQCASPSTTGCLRCLRFVRISTGVRCGRLRLQLRTPTHRLPG